MGRRAGTPLTARQVATLTKVGYTADALQPGLNLQVIEGVSGFTRSWVFRYTSPTTLKRREIGLGSLATRSLAEAREEALKLRRLVSGGVDPKVKRDEERRTQMSAFECRVIFRDAVVRCVATREHEWKNPKHRHQWTATLETYAFPVLGDLPVQDITTDLVLQVLEPIWLTKTETATRVRQRIEAVLDWCKARKLIQGENPASLKSGLGELLPKANKIKKVVHQPALPYRKAHSFVQALRERRGIGAKALEFLLLTAARSGEVLGATWEEFDFNSNVWTIPASRMKAGREHRVPLTKRAREILKLMEAGRQGAFVFPDPSGKKAMSNGALLAVMKGMPAYKDYVPHGLRSTFRDWASETTDVANETLELALAHTIKNRVEAAYRRGDQLEKRAALMGRWANFIESKPTNATVVGLRGRMKA